MVFLVDVASVANEDWNDQLETEDVQLGLDEAMPSAESDLHNTEEEYSKCLKRITVI